MKKFKDSKSKGTPLYNEDIFFNSSHKELKHLMASSEHIAPLIKVLDEENELLKGELRCVSSDLASFIDIVELLIDENRELREHINMKNQDFKKLIETIGLNDGEHIQELKHKIHIISEENNILIKHLDEMKKFKDNYENFTYEKEQDMLKARDVYEQLNYDLEESKKREENACRQLAIMEPKYKDLQEGLLKKEQEIEDLKHNINKHENQIKLLSSQLDLTKKTLQDMESSKELENDQLLQENTLLSHNLKDIKTELKEREKQFDIIKEDLNRIKRDKDEINGILEDTTQEISELKTQLGLHMSRAEQSIQRERETNEKNELMMRDNQRITNRVQQLEKQNNTMLDSHKNELQSKHLSYEKLIDKLKIKHKEHLQIKDEEADRLAKEVDNLKRVNESERKENQGLKEELNDLKDKNIEYEHQKVIEQQRLEINYLKKEIMGLRVKNEQTISKLQTEYKEENEALKGKLNNCVEECEKSKKFNDEIQYEHNLLKKENIGLSNENKELLETHEFYKSELQKYAKMQPESIQTLINENHELRETSKLLEKKMNEMLMNQQQQNSVHSNAMKAEPPTKLDDSFQLKKVMTQNQKELELKNKEMSNQIVELNKKVQDLSNNNKSAGNPPKRIFETERINPYLYPSPVKPLERKDITKASPPQQQSKWVGSPPSQLMGQSGTGNYMGGMYPGQEGMYGRTGNDGMYGRTGEGAMYGGGRTSNYLSNQAYLNTPDSYL